MRFRTQRDKGSAAMDHDLGFFDLGAEIRDELAHADTSNSNLKGEEVVSVKEVVEDFKQAVAKNIPTHDSDTHLNLAIAYREMGFLEEAIQEFQIAAKDPSYLVDCCSALGVCFREKGRHREAIDWYRRGLSAPDISQELALAMLYDMANTYITLNDLDSAYQAFYRIHRLDTGYRDVAARLSALGFSP